MLLDIIANATMLLKAVVEAIYKSPKMVIKTPARMVALTGDLRVGWTLAKTLEYGRPLSRENAHRSLPEVTKQLINAP